jgi:hypothetical protein
MSTPYYKDMPASQLVNKVVKYLNKAISGAYKFRISPNKVDIYMIVLYQIPYKSLRPGDPDKYSEVQEMHININLTTYQNKLRMNLIEMSPEERTLGFFVIPPEKITDLEFAKYWVMNNLEKTLNKLFDGYIFLF